ncbi:hypothetical protein PTKIN_Ptkin08bG0182700 [Pterospermum kingtungense]
MASSPENSPSQDSPPAPSSSSSNSTDSNSPSPSSSPTSSPSPPPPPQSSSSSSSSSPSPSSSSSSSPPPPPPSNNNNNNNNNNSPSPPPPPPPSSHKSSSSNNPSPPPPPKSSGTNSSTSSSSSSSDDTTSSNSSSSDTDVKVIIGVAVGAGLLLLLVIILLARCAQKKKKKSNQQMQYFPPQDGKGSGGPYYNNSPNPQWGTGFQGADHVVKVPPPQGGGWGSSPMQHPGYSGEASSNFSGPHHPPLPPPSPGISLGFNKSTFSYEELQAATGGFSRANLLGQGGFGYVHKGVLPNGKEVAVKSLKTGSGQGEREFQAEVEIISRVHHRYLVSLVGYCIAGEQRMLVYEFLPNNTLEYHLHGKDLPVMEFSSRLRIALGSAKGLAYLHEDCHPRIIHRDIKAANILLDYSFEAKVADFGLAKLSSDNYTHVSTRVMGTFGYLAPEYASSGKLTEKSDVFSFGVMLLELITGKQPVDHTNTMDDSLVDWARPLLARALEDGNHEGLVDPRLEDNYNHTEMQRLVACAAASIRHSARKRPKMSQIVRALEGDSSLDDLNEGIKPGQSTIFGSGSSEYSSSSYNADLQRFRQLALSSQEFEVSGEYGTSSSSDHSREMQKQKI